MVCPCICKGSSEIHRCVRRHKTLDAGGLVALAPFARAHLPIGALAKRRRARRTPKVVEQRISCGADRVDTIVLAITRPHALRPPQFAAQHAPPRVLVKEPMRISGKPWALTNGRLTP